ncbi:hypothetical protein RGR602_CH00334 [Rhizobium gallicum bv. gallicum R602sp]|uniref:Uncharacterized protein n=1 Tax=Rhizobium gallicum bv. gallicum R602sp TaxID=1041138 RepID=A0A0B4WYQ5_9HYPH|nr:hypothetical protein RGR602_CH00334 [Rhizobium gallicum bv. gallicum R602sp]
MRGGLARSKCSDFCAHCPGKRQLQRCCVSHPLHSSAKFCHFACPLLRPGAGQHLPARFARWGSNGRKR